MNRVVRASASGKLILVGEHAVVYGHPALAFAVSQTMDISVYPVEGASRVTSAFDDPRCTALLHRLFGAEGAHVEISTALPVGRGMGSSAALAVAVTRAAHAWHHPNAAPLTPDEVFQQALPIETLFHNNPSGLDVAVSAWGGVLKYQRGTPPILKPLCRPRLSFVVLDTGRVGVTSELVQHVAAQRPGINAHLERIGALATEAERHLENPVALGEVLTANQAELRAIGVSTPQIDAYVDLALQHGAHGAKLSGAGGGGVVIALTSDPEPLLQAAHQRQIAAWPCSTSEVG
ncbi:MAG: mevalonate kinase [Myxococcota bacterium]